MIVVFYNSSGTITEVFSAPLADITARGQPYIEVASYGDYDSTHYISNGVLTPIPQATLDAQATADAMTALRVQRNAKLVADCDSMNGMRWAAQTPENQAAWTAYRYALLNLPQTTTDPTNVVWPVIPTNTIVDG